MENLLQNMGKDSVGGLGGKYRVLEKDQKSSHLVVTNM